MGYSKKGGSGAVFIDGQNWPQREEGRPPTSLFGFGTPSGLLPTLPELLYRHSIQANRQRTSAPLSFSTHISLMQTDSSTRRRSWTRSKHRSDWMCLVLKSTHLGPGQYTSPPRGNSEPFAYARDFERYLMSPFIPLASAEILSIRHSSITLWTVVPSFPGSGYCHCQLLEDMSQPLWATLFVGEHGPDFWSGPDRRG